MGCLPCELLELLLQKLVLAKLLFIEAITRLSSSGQSVEQLIDQLLLLLNEGLQRCLLAVHVDNGRFLEPFKVLAPVDHVPVLVL